MNAFKSPILAKRIRIVPTGYQSHPVQLMCLRAELYGCRYDLGKVIKQYSIWRSVQELYPQLNKQQILKVRFLSWNIIKE